MSTTATKQQSPSSVVTKQQALSSVSTTATKQQAPSSVVTKQQAPSSITTTVIKPQASGSVTTTLTSTQLQVPGSEVQIPNSVAATQETMTTSSAVSSPEILHKNKDNVVIATGKSYGGNEIHEHKLHPGCEKVVIMNVLLAGSKTWFPNLVKIVLRKVLLLSGHFSMW